MAEPTATSDPILFAARLLAAAGGLVMFAVAVMVSVSIAGRETGFGAVPGDFEFVQIGMAIAAFAFFPKVQLTRGQIIVDIATNGLSRGLTAALDALWDLVAAAVAGFIAWRLWIGARETAEAGTTTMMLQLPQAPAIYLASVLAGIWAVAALVAAWRRLKG
jgi:TRAP-type C4-dicarboxylate transport system permease small subunit